MAVVRRTAWQGVREVLQDPAARAVAASDPHVGRRAALLAGSLATAALLRTGAATAQARRSIPGKAGLLITGQSNAGFFLEDGGLWRLNEGLAALLGLERATFDPRLDGFRTIDGYALRDGAHRDPAMATTHGGTPLWAPGDAGAFLVQRTGRDPSAWQRGAAGQALDRFVRDLLSARDRADCLGILWIHTESDSGSKRMQDVATHAAAIRRHLALIRAAFGRPAVGPGELPAYGWSPIPYGSSAEGHRAVRAALAEVVADPVQNFRLAIAQTADSEPRDGSDWSHRDAVDLRTFARRAAYAIARHQRDRHGLGPADLPGAGPRIARVNVENPTTTLLMVSHDRGQQLRASNAARDGRGWSVFDGGIQRGVTGMEIRGAGRIALRHAACTDPRGGRAVGYCLHGEQLGRGNAVTDDWSSFAALPGGLDEAWRFDFSLQATLTPVLAD